MYKLLKKHEKIGVEVGANFKDIRWRPIPEDAQCTSVPLNDGMHPVECTYSRLPFIEPPMGFNRTNPLYRTIL